MRATHRPDAESREAVDLQRRTLLKAPLALLGATSLAPLAACGSGPARVPESPPSPSASPSFPKRNPALALGVMPCDSFIHRSWAAPEEPWARFRPLPVLFAHGFEWMRLWVTTQSFPALRAVPPVDWRTFPWRDEYWSCLEVSGAHLREAANAGFRLHAVLFLSHVSAHAGRQLRPPAWEGLSEEAVAERIEQHSREVAAYYKSLGLGIEVFQIGNETDFGLCGVYLGENPPFPPRVDPVNDPDWMHRNVWSRIAPFVSAAARGVRGVYPGASILLHVAGFGYSRDDIAPKAFFQSMVDLGVSFDIAGLSYPYLHSGEEVPQPYFRQPPFLDTLSYVAGLGKRVQIVEFDYPNAPGGMLHPAAPGYPFAPDGQAAFVTDFATALRGRLDAIQYFYPDWYPGYDPSHPELENCGLFASPDTAQPAMEVFKAIAEGRLLA